MSTDYRPRGGGEGGGRSSGSSSSGGGARRRRGGRGRSSSGHSHSGETRPHSNGTSSSTPKKKEGFLSKLMGIFTGKKSDKPEIKHTPRTSSAPASRPDFKEREPRAERPRREDRPERPPKVEATPQEIVSPKLYVGNLAYEAAESDLFDLFSKVGHVKNVEVAMDRRAGRSKGFGFVEMESIETAKAAAEKLNRTDFMDRQIVVSGAKLDKRPIGNSHEETTDATSQDAGESTSSTDSTI